MGGGGVFMATEEEARAVKRRHSPQLLRQPGVCGVGVEKDEQETSSSPSTLTLRTLLSKPAFRSNLRAYPSSRFIAAHFVNSLAPNSASQIGDTGALLVGAQEPAVVSLASQLSESRGRNERTYVGKRDSRHKAEEVAKADSDDSSPTSCGWATSFYSSPGFLSERMHLSEARVLTRSRAQPEADERIGRFTIAQLRQRLIAHRFEDAKTLIGLLWLLGEK